MPRTCSDGLLKVINSQVPTLAVLIRLTRADGVVMGFTSTNRNLTIEGTTFEKSSAISPSALRSTVGAGVDNMDLMGLISSDNITDVDILAGRYDGAELELFLCNYRDVNQGVLVLPRGTLGQVTLEDGTYVAEFRSLAQRLQQEILDVTQPECRAPAFGDPATCASGGLIGGHPLSYFTRTGLVVTLFLSQYQFVVASADPDGFFDYGLATCTAGLNAGIQGEVKLSTMSAGTALIALRQAMPFQLQVGDVFTVVAGCDRRFSTCLFKFSNLVNFRGEPSIPGVDQMIQRGR